MTDTSSPPNLELILEAEHWLTHDAAYTNKRASGLIRRLCTALSEVETDRNRLDRELAAEIEEHAASEQRLARDRDAAMAEVSRLSRQRDMDTGAQSAARQVEERLDAIHDDVRRTDAKAQHIVETVLRLRAREDLAAVMGYELGHDDAKAEVTDAPAGCPTRTGPLRETVGMVCQTCGTDYAPDAPDGDREWSTAWERLDDALTNWATVQDADTTRELRAAIDAYQAVQDRQAVAAADGHVCQRITVGAADAPAAAATTGGAASCDVCERPHPTVEYRPGANGHICRPCANVTVTGGEAQA